MRFAVQAPTCLWIRLLLAGWVSASQPSLALAGAQIVAAGAAQQVQVQKRAPVVPEKGVTVAMLPRLLTGPLVSAEVADRVNRSLDAFNAEAVRDAKECARAERELGGAHIPDFQRSIETTMQGPHYLSFVATDAFSCGGATLNDGELALVYDLRTGLPVNWTRWLPAAARGKVYREKGQLPIGVVHWPVIVQKAKAMPADGGDECKHVYDNPDTDLNVWLDAKKKAVVFSPQLGNHYDVAMCSQRVEIKAGEAAKLGLAPGLVEELR